TWSPPSGAAPRTVGATFAYAYDWSNMPATLDGGPTLTQVTAVGRLLYDVGVAFGMNFGFCGSGAYTDQIGQILPAHFKYRQGIATVPRATTAAATFFG